MAGTSHYATFWPPGHVCSASKPTFPHDLHKTCDPSSFEFFVQSSTPFLYLPALAPSHSNPFWCGNQAPHFVTSCPHLGMGFVPTETNSAWLSPISSQEFPMTSGPGMHPTLWPEIPMKVAGTLGAIGRYSRPKVGTPTVQKIRLVNLKHVWPVCWPSKNNKNHLRHRFYQWVEAFYKVSSWLNVFWWN